MARFWTPNSMSSSSGTRRLLDPRLRILIENNVKKNHRSFIVLVGDRSRDRVRSQPIYPGSKLKACLLRSQGSNIFYHMLETSLTQEGASCGVTKKIWVSVGSYTVGPFVSHFPEIPRDTVHRATSRMLTTSKS